MEWNILINPVVGGVIGYATNYLAIKMLFRPYTSKYIGNIKIPFTPGLIPKEKATLARQMGEITEEYLLTEDMLVETLTGPKAKEVFGKFAHGIPGYIEESGQTISEALQTILGDELEISLDSVKDYLTLESLRMLKSKEVMDLAIPYISKAVSEIARDNMSKGIENHSISQYIKQLSHASLESEKTREHIYSSLDELEEKAYDLLRQNAATIGEGVIAAIGTGEEAEKIKETLQHWIDENFNPMVSMFIKIDKIYEGIIDFAKEALEDPERNTKFGDLLCTVVKGIKESQLDYKDKAINIIKDQINDENINMLIDLAVEELSKEEIAIKVQIEKWIYNQWQKFTNSEEFANLVNNIIEEIVGLVGGISLANISTKIPYKINNKISETIFSYYTNIIENNSTSVAQVMDISHLVESKINEFSSQEAEKVILSVVKTQLRGITWIGALLGTLIGILSNFIG